jgi:hypothetical protein
MANEWFFKWHHIGREQPIEIDSFRGKPIVYGGIRFSGSAHDVYWDTIQHYLRKKISSLFDELEQEVKAYPVEIRRQPIREARLLIRGFAGRIRQMAVEKDRILRGDGIKFPPERDFGIWNGSGPRDIEDRANSLLRIYVDQPRSSSTFSERANMLWDTHRWLIGIVTLMIAALGLLALF